MPKLTQEYLKLLLWYCPNTGNFIRITRRKGIKLGEIAGNINKDGYVRICIDKKLYLAHLLAFLYMTGKWPENDIDHIDLNKANNIWSNLREATRSQNKGNVTKYITNTSGIKGVTWDKRNKMWRAKIQVNYKYICLGRYFNKETAAQAYIEAAVKYFGEYARAA